MSDDRTTLSKKIRFQVLKRDGFRCQYCGASPPMVQLEVDHVIPASAGGIDDESNLVAACEACNMGKGDTVIAGTESRHTLEILAERRLLAMAEECGKLRKKYRMSVLEQWTELNPTARLGVDCKLADELVALCRKFTPESVFSRVEAIVAVVGYNETEVFRRLVSDLG